MDQNSIHELRTYGFNKAKIELTEDDIKTIDYYAGRFPFFNQIVCSYMFDAKIQHVDIDKRIIISNLLKHYETIWESRTCEEQNLLKKLGSPALHEKEYVFIDMIVRGVLEIGNEYYCTFSPFFYDLMMQTFKVKKMKFLE